MLVVSTIVSLAVLVYAHLAGHRGRGRDPGDPDLDLPSDLPDPGHRRLQRLRRRRPVQPVRQLRDPADRQLCAADLGRHQGTAAGRRPVHRGVAAVLADLPVGDRDDLRRDRDGEPGRPVGQAGGRCRTGIVAVLQAMLLVAFGVKAAVFPMSAWLPDSYPSAPAPVTAVFAGLLTKVGIYAIIRVQTLLFPTGSYGTLLMIAALLTMVVGILGAVSQSGHQTDAVVHPGLAHRLHAVRRRAGLGGRPRRGDLLRGAPHPGADGAVPGGRPDRAGGRHDGAGPARRAGRGRADPGDPVLHPGDEPGRGAAAVRVPGQGRPVRGRHRRTAGCWR